MIGIDGLAPSIIVEEGWWLDETARSCESDTATSNRRFHDWHRGSAESLLSDFAVMERNSIDDDDDNSSERQPNARNRAGATRVGIPT